MEARELELRVKEWNAEVEKLATERGLTGRSRDKFLEKEGASAFAPCGNPR